MQGRIPSPLGARVRLGPASVLRHQKPLAGALRYDNADIRKNAAFVLAPREEGEDRDLRLIDALATNRRRPRLVRPRAGESRPPIPPSPPPDPLAARSFARRPRVILAVLIRLGPQARRHRRRSFTSPDADAGLARGPASPTPIGPTAGRVPALVGRVGDPDADVRDGRPSADEIGPEGVPDLTPGPEERDPTPRAAAEVLAPSAPSPGFVDRSGGRREGSGPRGVQKAAAEAIKRIQADNGDSPRCGGTTLHRGAARGDARRGDTMAEVRLFFPWGPYSAAAGEAGQRAEECWRRELLPTITRGSARAQRAELKPDEWRARQRTGARYIVLTPSSRTASPLEFPLTDTPR